MMKLIIDLWNESRSTIRREEEKKYKLDGFFSKKMRQQSFHCFVHAGTFPYLLSLDNMVAFGSIPNQFYLISVVVCCVVLRCAVLLCVGLCLVVINTTVIIIGQQKRFYVYSVESWHAS